MARIAFIFLFIFLLFSGNQSSAQWTVINLHYTATGIKNDGGTVLKAGDFSWDEGENKTIAAADGLLLGSSLGSLVGNKQLSAASFPQQHIGGLAAFKGVIEAADDGSFTYTHTGDELLGPTVNFVYTVDDDDNGNANATIFGTVTIHLVAVNDAPVALSNSENIDEGQVVNGNIREGKWYTDPDHTGTVNGVPNRFTGTVAFSIGVGARTYGTLNAFNATTGDFTFTANSNIIGNDNKVESWNFTLDDGIAGAVTGVISININNELPNPVNDVVNVNVGETVDFNTLVGGLGILLQNDPGTGGRTAGGPISPPTRTVNDQIICTTAGNAPIVCSNGTFKYIHDGAIDHIADVFTYSFDNGIEAGSNGTVNVNINQCPIPKHDTYTVNEGATLTVSAANGVIQGKIVANGGIKSVNDVAPISGQPAGPDVDLNGFTNLIATKTSDPAHHVGTFTLNANGSFTYVHDDGGSLTDQFTYTVRDNGNAAPKFCVASAAVTVVIKITPVNDCPISTNDTYTIVEGFAMDVPVGSGFVLGDAGDNAKNYGTRKTVGGPDTDEESNTLTAVQVGGNPTGFLGGTWLFRADGSFTYSHDPASGVTSTSFQYKLTDNGTPVACDAAAPTRTVNIIIINEIPVSVLDAYNCAGDANQGGSHPNGVAEGGTLTVLVGTGLLANDPKDPNPNDVITIDITDQPDHGVISCIAPGAPVGANRVCDNGSFQYVHTSCVNDVAQDQFTYRLHDGDDYGLPVTVTICIYNECPIKQDDTYPLLLNDDGFLLADDHNGLVTPANPDDDGVLSRLTGGLKDRDGGTGCDPLTVAYKPGNGPNLVGAQLTCPSTPAVPSPVICSNGTFNYSHQAGSGIADTFDYTLSDGECTPVPATVNITVNACPTGTADEYLTTEGGTLNITVPGAVPGGTGGGGVIYGKVGGAKTVGGVDSEPNGSVMTASLKPASGPAYGTIECIAPGTPVGLNKICLDGTFKYVHNNLENGGDLTDEFTYILTDGVCDVDVGVIINITPVNDCPVGTDDTYTVDEDETITTTAAQGVILGAAFIPLAPPATWTKTVGAADTDPDIGGMNILTVTLQNAPSQATSLTCPTIGDPRKNDASPVICTDGSFSYDHNGSENNDSFTYFLSDNGAGCNNQGPYTVTILINGLNDCPVAVPVIGPITYTVLEGSTTIFTDFDGTATAGTTNDNGVKANGDSDIETSIYALAWQKVADPSEGDLKNLQTNGGFTYEHNGGNAATDFFTYRVQDIGCIGGSGAPGFSNTVRVDINITPINNCPVAEDDAYLNISNEGELLNVSKALGVIDANGDVLEMDTDDESDAFIVRHIATGGPFFGTLTCPTSLPNPTAGICPDGSFQYQHNGTENLNDSFNYEAVDESGTCADPEAGPRFGSTATVTINVSQRNDCPTAIDDVYTMDENGTLLADGLLAKPKGVINKENTSQANAKDSDPEGDAFTVQLKPIQAGQLLHAISLTCPSNALASPTICPDGTFQYVHDGSETTIDRFEYEIIPGVACVVAGDDTGEVVINITPAPDCPIVFDETYTVTEGGTLELNNCNGGPCNVWLNDDNDGDGIVNTNDNDILQKAYVVVTPPTHGSLTCPDNALPSPIICSDGLFVYTHDHTETPSGAGADSFTYKTNNVECDSNVGTVTFNVTPVNDVPVGVPDVYTCIEDQSININDANGSVGTASDDGVLVNDSDPDNAVIAPPNIFAGALTAVIVTPPTHFDQAAAGGPLALANDGTFIYFHDGVDDGNPDTFTYKTLDGNCDGLGALPCPITTVTINITPVNDCPIGQNDTYSVFEAGLLQADGIGGHPNTVILNTNPNGADTDEDGNAMTATLGALQTVEDRGIFNFFSPAGSFNYQHDGTENFGPFTFQYTLSDNFGCVDQGPYTVTINVIPVNECPVVKNSPPLVDDFYTGILEEGTLIINTPLTGVLKTGDVANGDFDPDGDNFTASVAVNPQFGTLTCPPPAGTNQVGSGICQNGTFQYVHDGTENFEDFFTYQLSDGNNDNVGNPCATQGLVKLTITPVNDPPVAADDLFYEVFEGQTLNVNPLNAHPNNLGVRANDSDPEQDVLDPNEVTLDWTCATCTGPTHHSNWIPSPDGTFIYQHDGTDAPNIDEITYRLDDNQAENNLSELPLATVRIRILNTPPVAIGENYTVDKCETLVGDDILGTDPAKPDGVLVNDTEVDPQDILTAALQTAAAHGTLTCPDNALPSPTICADGSFQYVHDGTPSPTTDSFTYFVSDGEDVTAAVTATITIVNQVPVPTPDVYTVDEGAILTVVAGVVGLKDNDTDANSCDVLEVTMKTAPMYHNETAVIVIAQNDPCLTNQQGGNCFTGGPFVTKVDGGFTYAHDGSETTQDSIMYRVSDGTATAPATKAIINITPINDPPIARNDTFGLFECDTINIDAVLGLKNNDEDVDNPIGLVEAFVVTPPSHGTLSCGALLHAPCRDGSFQYIHNGDDSPNVDTFTYRLYDGTPDPALAFSENATVRIEIGNRPPPGAQNETYSVNECKTIIINAATGVLANDTDPDCKDVITIIMKDLPAMGSFIVNADGSFTYSHNCTDNPDDTYFTYFVTDGEDTTVVADTAKILINNVCTVGNDDLYENVLEGGKLIVNADSGVLHNDNDQNPLDILTVIAPIPYENTIYGILTLNADGSFDYVHDDSENFEDVFKYIMNDGECTENDTVTVTIRITPVPDTPPVALPDSYPCIDEDSVLQTLTYLEGVLGNDYDLDEKDSVLTAVIVVFPLNGSLILNPNGTFIYNHDGGETTSDSFTYYATDGDFNTDTVTVTLCINPVNDCPVPVSDVFNINEGQEIDSSLVLNDSDIEVTSGIQNHPVLIRVLDDPRNVDGDVVGNLFWHPDGTFKYNPPRHILAPGPEVVTFDYLISDDGFVLCDSSATVTITIAHINDCPLAVNDSIEFDASSPVSLIKDLIANDSDLDSDLDSTSIEITRNPDFGEVIVNNDGTITYNFDNSPTNYDTLIYTVRDVEGCPSNLAYLFIHANNLNPSIYELPNYFTPNNDLFNDAFVIKYQNILEQYIGFKVNIYDRYERIIYSSDTVTTDQIWNGNNTLGQPVQSDFYYFEVTPVEYRGTKYERTKDILVGTLYLERSR